MKIFANISAVFKFISSLKYLTMHKKEIEAARACEDYEREREYILKAEALWGPMIMESLGSTVNVQGIENLPDKGPVVFIGNHQGYADIFSYLAAFHNFQFAFVAKEELSKIPIYGKWMDRIRCVFIKRKHPRAALKAISEGISYIEKGFSLVIFPEGTRSQGPEMGKFHRGSLKLATKPGVPIVPISLNGSYKMFEEQGYLKSTDIDIMVHKPIETKNISRQEEKALADKVEKIVRDGVKQLQEASK